MLGIETYVTFSILPNQENALKVRPLRNTISGARYSEMGSEGTQPVILMRAKGNPGIFVEVCFEAFLLPGVFFCDYHIA
jgi:hypothetical protein